MNTQRIAAAAREIDRLATGLKWLREYGVTLVPENFHIAISTGHAASCLGYHEAVAQLSAVARLHIETIIQNAIDDAENTIEIHTAAIREEAGAG